MKNILLLLSFLISFSSTAQTKKSFLREGNKLYADSSYNEAEIQFRKSLEKDQDYFNASFNLADAIYKQERYDEASGLFNALKNNTANEIDLAKIYHNLGNSLAKEKKIEDAINAYKDALRINPNDNDTRHNLALCNKQKKEQEKKDQQEENEDQQEENKDQQEENKDQQE
jgi:tetratricopeptide (TPR) repeat protein